MPFFCDTSKAGSSSLGWKNLATNADKPVEEGVPFCPHCSAPQIRVVVAEPAPLPALAAAEAGLGSLPAAQTVPVLALPMQWSQALRPCLLAALVASGLMSLGLHPFVAMLSVGFLAVIFYRQRRPRNRAQGRVWGRARRALAGLLWFAMSSILEALIVIFFIKGRNFAARFSPKSRKLLLKPTTRRCWPSSTDFKTPEGT